MAIKDGYETMLSTLSAVVRRLQSRYHRRKPAKPVTRPGSYGAVEQVQLSCSDDGQQERNRSRLLHPVRRHVRRARRSSATYRKPWCTGSQGLPMHALRARGLPPPVPESTLDQAAICRTSSRPEGYGQPCPSTMFSIASWKAISSGMSQYRRSRKDTEFRKIWCATLCAKLIGTNTSVNKPHRA